MHRLYTKSMKVMAVVLGILAVTACDDEVASELGEEVVVTEEVITGAYIGNGFQWDPYPQAVRELGQTISEADWQKMYKRLDFMKPKFMRVVYGASDKYAATGADNYQPDLYFEELRRILQYCQDNNITVMAGDWGFNQFDLTQNTVIANRVKNAAKYLNYLIEDKGFTCIKYYNTVNEPNYVEAATGGSYDLWLENTKLFVQEFEALGNRTGVKIAGPDIAYFGALDGDWVSDAANDLGSDIGLYDVHTYPPLGQMFSGEYESVLKEMVSQVPTGSQIVLGEFGYQYASGTSNLDRDLLNRNIQNINSDPNIGDDSNTMVKEFFHGVDMMGMVMKIINAGYAGCANWSLDDAMHTMGSGREDFKVWGMWNIIGEEYLGDASQEELRPHFYAYSLLTRYMQDGSTVYRVNVPKMVGFDAIAVEKNGKVMLAFNNMFIEDHTVNLKFANGLDLTGLKKFVYKEDGRKVDADGFPVPEEEGLTLDANGNVLTFPAQTFTVYTNFDF